MDMLYLRLAIVIGTFFCGGTNGLQCWHCIADDCNDDPADNYKADKKVCAPDQACQKVYFRMLEETEKGNVEHESVVRSCSTMCESRNDFDNCTVRQLTSDGCVRKDCCSDGDLCNSSRGIYNVSYSVILTQCLVILAIIKWNTLLCRTKH